VSLSSPGWLGVLEGFYGDPFDDADRLDLIRWAGTAGCRDYVYAPKGDPLLRDNWRAKAPDSQRVTDMLAVATDAGVTLSMVISPGLDWAGDADVEPLVAKLRDWYDAGVRSLGIAWDDVRRGGADLGRSHGGAVAAAVAALPGDVRWATCPNDYAVRTPTAYLKAFADAVPAQVGLMWTGPSVVSPTITAADVRTLSTALGRRLVLADNVPVNDGPMAGVLHLGPYPARDPAVVTETDGLLLNLMALPRASRVTVAAALRWWRDPTRDRLECWEEAVAEFPGIRPLARSARSWFTDPGPDPELVEWLDAALGGDDRRLSEWIAAGCRNDLPADWQAELEPWLLAWESYAFVLEFIVQAAHAPAERRLDAGFAVGEAWRRAQVVEQQLFGIRYALYGAIVQDGEEFRLSTDSVVRSETLVDRACSRTLERLCAGA
jgi:hypothetical protein